jgi:hypothetical protein
MGEKAFASLSSGLLARKGQARPAMRRQGFGLGMGNPEDLGWNDMGYNDTASDLPRSAGPRLPSNLSGPPALVVPGMVANAEVPVVVVQQEEIAQHFEELAAPVEPATPAVEPVTDGLSAERAKRPTRRPAARRSNGGQAVASSSVGGSSGGLSDLHRKAAFTLRLDADRHLRLRLACAVQNRSAQQIVTEALDRLLDSLPDVERLAASLPDTSRN